MSLVNRRGVQPLEQPQRRALGARTAPVAAALLFGIGASDDAAAGAFVRAEDAAAFRDGTSDRAAGDDSAAARSAFHLLGDGGGGLVAVLAAALVVAAGGDLRLLLLLGLCVSRSAQPVLSAHGWLLGD